MSQSNDSGLNLDHLEAQARAADQDGQHIYTNPRDSNNWRANEIWHYLASPAAVLELIALARRAALANQPAPTDWQAAHADMVKRNALLRERPDLPADRIPAHAELMRLQEENARLRANQPAPPVPATRDAIEEAAQVFEAAADHNRSKGRTILAHSQQSRANRIRKELDGAPAHQPAQEQAEPDLWVQYIDGVKTQNVARDAEEKATVERTRRIMAPGTAMTWRAFFAAQQEPVAAPQQAAAPGNSPEIPDGSLINEGTSAPGTPEAPAKLPRLYRFDCYVGKTKMAAGVGVHASTMEEAEKKTRKLIEKEETIKFESNDPCHATRKCSICAAYDRAAQLDGGQEGSGS